MSYPLTIRFKVLAIARQLSLENSAGQLLMYVKQKAFKLREAITVYADATQTRELYHVKADRIIDFSARYTITDGTGEEIGAVRQQGMRSIWRARYDILRGDDVVFEVKEENPWAKVGDQLVQDIPFLSGFLFHPRYLVSTADGREVLRASKESAWFEGRFRIDRLATPLNAQDERLLIIGAVTTVMLEKTRG